MTSGSQDKFAKLKVPVTERDHYQGKLDAPIQLVEYGDYQCPHCSSANIVVHDLLKRMGDQVNYVFRHFPLSKIHPEAQQAAEVAEAAGAQGKYWEMHELLFENSNRFKEENLFIELAEELELDIDQFNKELEEKTHASRIKEDFSSGARSGVNGTPTMFLNGTRYDGAWDLESLLEMVEKPLGVRIRLVTQEFAQLAAAGGIMLLLFTLIGLALANFLPDKYFNFFDTDLAFEFGDFSVHEHLIGWINDGLMAIFFFVVGLEIKREVTVGELATLRKAALPVIGAVGGMVFPALFYIALNFSNPDKLRGWGIPMATDIAFTIVLLTVLGNRIPFTLKVFFSALAIADDLGAIIVIAIFYPTKEIVLANLVLIAFVFVLLLGMNRAKVYWTLPYLILGIVMWILFLESGVHATMTGVLLALTIPTRSPANTKGLLSQCVTLLDEYEISPVDAENRRQSMINTLETITDRMQSPAQRMERDLQPWTTFLILPIFALANAGVVLSMAALSTVFDSVALGIILGLVVGKPLGITLLAYLAVRSGIGEMPKGVNWNQFISASFLAGIGFTISLFLANTAFVGVNDPSIVVTAKIGILVASLLAATIGMVLLTKNKSDYDSHTVIDIPVSS
ncbi:MAG: Na(+)/H(+) antiporter NhaA [Candidatus Heimdallarchaeota archaeon LC_3]|nr:MAG: Na(+)/H(+) antiporter NhaA [Candidatus Heimdallarchaeota archaeon LC_3]